MGLDGTKQDYYKTTDFERHLTRMAHSSLVNNYFSIRLLSLKVNFIIQLVYDYYKAITYTCAHLSKTEDEYSYSMEQTAQEERENNGERYIKVKSIVKAYTTRREVSVQEAVYLVLSELWLRLAFLDVIFVNSNIPEKRFCICLSGKIYQKITQ